MRSGERQLGRTMVLYPGHALVGRIVSVVRRYGGRERGQWIIELSDGSRQHVPISWCSPLSSSEEPPPMPTSSPDEPSPQGATPSPLSLEALRNLAAVVRRLQEEATQRGEEQQDAGHRSGKEAQRDHTSEEGRHSSAAQRDAGVAAVGELPSGGSTSPGAQDPPDSTPSDEDTADRWSGEEVKES